MNHSINSNSIKVNRNEIIRLIPEIRRRRKRDEQYKCQGSYFLSFNMQLITLYKSQEQKPTSLICLNISKDRQNQSRDKPISRYRTQNVTSQKRFKLKGNLHTHIFRRKIRALPRGTVNLMAAMLCCPVNFATAISSWSSAAPLSQFHVLIWFLENQSCWVGYPQLDLRKCGLNSPKTH